MLENKKRSKAKMRTILGWMADFGDQVDLRLCSQRVTGNIENVDGKIHLLRITDFRFDLT